MALINRDVLAQVLADGQQLKLAVDRGTGKTTAAVLGALSAAINYPGDWMNVIDDGSGDREVVVGVVERVVQALQLQRISIDSPANYPYVQVRSDFAEVLE